MGAELVFLQTSKFEKFEKILLKKIEPQWMPLSQT
jgi:hypothetical protein